MVSATGGKAGGDPAAPEKTENRGQGAEKTKEKKEYLVRVFLDWCKACGICVAFCPKKVFERDENGKAIVAEPDKCIGCMFCELHCPDFAITVEEKNPYGRRKSDARSNGQ